jgi:hypothetical protein
MPKPPIPAPCVRIDWHCDKCGGDSIFDIREQHRPGNKMRCLGCGHEMAMYVDVGIVGQYFRARGTDDWQTK